MAFSKSVISELHYYVYLYSDPTTGVVFYVGEGQGNRVFSHLKDKSDSEKTRKIQELRDQGLEPKVEILIHGLKDKDTAQRVESAAIDLIGKKRLTNKQGGHKSATFGRMSPSQVVSAYEKRKVEIVEPAILIRISQAFRYDMTEMELYDYTRGQWPVNLEKVKKAKYAFSIYGGVIQEVYEILHWYKAGMTYSVREGNENIKRGKGVGLDGRYEFIGNLASDCIRKKYRYKSVENYLHKRGDRFPVRYVNIG